MAHLLPSSAFVTALLLTILLLQKTPFTCGGKVDEKSKQELRNSFFKSMSSGICDGQKVDVKKVSKSLAVVEKKCKTNDKDEVPIGCYLAEFGYMKSPTEAYEDQKKVTRNLKKFGWYGDSTIKKIVKEIFSQNCHKKFGVWEVAAEVSKDMLNRWRSLGEINMRICN